MASTTESTTAMNTTPSYLAGLNDMQKIAVTHTEGPAIVIAGAGSGKTKVLTSRIAHILKEKRAEPHQILALTFTNKAAAEMRHRIECIVGNMSKSIWLGTFHSVFVKLLRQEAVHLGYPCDFSIYDTDDSKSLLKQIVKEFNLDDKVYKPGLLLSRISHAKNKLISPQMYASDSAYQMEDAHMRLPRFSEIFLKYANHCRQSGAMDFDDLLTQTHVLLYHHCNVSIKYQQQFRYLFIDEFQDTNLVQYNIAKKLAALHHNICVVGDDAQSIYAFRGATIQNILNFSTDYPKHHVTKLEQNYRSSQHIVAAANSIISYNASQLKKIVWTTNPLGDPITVIKAPSEVEESRLVAAMIATQKRNQQLRYSDVTILYRTNNQSRSFEEAFRKQQLPYRIIGGLSFYHRKEVKDLIAYLRFIVNHNDSEAFKRIINCPKRGIGSGTIDKIFSLLAENNIDIWTLLQQGNDFFSGTIAGAIAHFVALIAQARLKLTLENENAYTIANYIAKESGFLKTLYEDKTVEGVSRYEHVQELLNGIKQFVDDPDHIDLGLGNFLQEISLLTKEDQDQTDQDAITLMTIHASKGLEFKYVYLVGMEEDLFPSAMMIGSQTDLEEERRLFYVAVTRAKLQLTLTYALSRYRFGKTTITRPSRFLQEFNAQYIDRTDAPAKRITQAALTPIRKLSVPPPARPSARSIVHPINDSNLTTLQIGYEVHHSQFGQGKVIQLIESSGVRKAVILFHKFGEKTLLLNYARLQIVNTTLK